MAWRSNATVFFNDTGCKNGYSSGFALTRAEAEAELIDVLKAVPGDVLLSFSSTETIDPVAAGVTFHAPGKYKNANLSLRKALTPGVFKTANRAVKNLATAYHPAATPEGTIDIANADIAAIATAYRDGEGVGGYTITANSKFDCE